MIALKDLREQNKEVTELLLESSGYGLWTVWQGDCSPVIAQTLEEYGGLEIASAKNQSLWFFFSIDAYLAAAKLAIWSQFNSLPVTMQIFGARVQCSPDHTRHIDITEDLWLQKIDAPLKFQFYASTDALVKNSAISSIMLNETERPTGFSPKREWRLAAADTRLAYKPQHNWFCVIHPITVAHDKQFLVSWRDFYERMNNILQRNKMRHTVHENFLLMPLNSLRQLKQWIRDYLALLDRLKEDEGGSKYWPCVMAIVDTKGLSFNIELPKQIGLDWDSMMPDTPFLPLQDAVLLGEDFEIHESHLALGRKTPDALCAVNLIHKDEDSEYALPSLRPANLIFGPHRHCFYCGQRSHASANCPSRHFKEVDSGIWHKIAACDSFMLREGAAEINRRLQDNPDAVDALFTSDDSAGTVTRGIFGICAHLQLRYVPTFWKAKGKLYPNALTEPRPNDDSPLWTFQSTMQGRDLNIMDKEMQTLQVRFPRDYKVFSLHGFIAMERGEFAQARSYWETAHLLSHPGVMQAWHFLLLGRLAEYQGDYHNAANCYDKMLEIAPTWLEGKYRKLICLIKSGFISRAEISILELMDEDANFFNWLLLDPEIERGAAQVLLISSRQWKNISLNLVEEKVKLGALQKELEEWFTPEHEFTGQSISRISKLFELGSVRNFVPYTMMAKGRAALEKDMQNRINLESKNFKLRFQDFIMRLGEIRDEAAWFPFPSVLGDFNKNYNASAANLNWVLKNNMRTPDVFRKAQSLSENEENRIKKLEKRLKLLRIVRDGTLFGLIAIKKFLWIELVGLALILAIFPLLIYYGQKIGATWISNAFINEQWAIQKGAIIVVSMVALVVSGLMTVLRFEAIREKTFEKARAEEARRSSERAKQINKLRSARRLQKLKAPLGKASAGTAKKPTGS
ncbi:MAG: tetratricopeptide repeat protein [Deltaproteobacteria bacterium]|jgi:tetratricopeptide (TPR) repeat protein|nr:tetratricopeptide repeat protein [Deltaproteobacteria bacterium]